MVVLSSSSSSCCNSVKTSFISFKSVVVAAATFCTAPITDVVVLGNEIVVDLLRLFVSLCSGKTCSFLCTNNGWSVTVSGMIVVASYNGALVSVDVEMMENLSALETVVNLCCEEKTETISD